MGSFYSPTPSWLHHLPTSVKLLSVLIGGSLLFSTRDLALLGAILTGLLLACCSLGKARETFLFAFKAVLLSSFLVLMLHAALGQPEMGLRIAARLTSASLLGFLLAVSTPFSSLLDTLETLLRPLQWLGLNPARPTLMIGMMLRFTEVFFLKWKKLDEAYRLRTGKRGYHQLLAPLLMQMLRSINKVGDALFCRSRD